MKKYYKSIIFMLVLLWAFNNGALAALDAPQPRCISINGGGVITIDWASTTGPGLLTEFVEYRLFKAGNINGPYNQLITFPNINTITFTDLAGSPGLNPVFYYLVTVYNDGAGNQLSQPSDTISPMILNDIMNGNYGELLWNPVASPNLPGKSNNYNIRRRPLTVPAFQNVANTAYGSEFFRDTIWNCNIDVAYQIELPGNACISRSNIDTVTFEDVVRPNMPIIDSVSINPLTGELIIGWSASNSQDVVAYETSIDSNGIFLIFPYNSTANLNYTFPGYQGLGYPQRASVQSIDSCGNTSAFPSYHRTVGLSLSANLCEASVELNWTPYEGWNTTAYNVFRRTNGGDFQLMASLPGNATNYSETKLDLTLSYDYFVRAIRAGASGSSSSNLAALSFELDTPPRFNHINYAKVIGESVVELEVFIDTTFPALEYRLMRATKIDGPYVSVAKRPRLQTDSLFVIRDEIANTGSFGYFYKFDVVDTCGQAIFTSNIVRTILLNLSFVRMDGLVRLNWNAYRGWDDFGNGVLRYRLYQSTGNDFEVVDSFGVNRRDFEKLIFDLTTNSPEICFYLEAIENGPNVYEFESLSHSNVQCIKEIPQIWVPNMFTPNNDGINEEFKPITYFANRNDYLFQIYDRWGNVIFETREPLQGWDGNINGEASNSNVYAWYVKVVSQDGRIMEKRGTVRLLR